ncbi:DUF2600 family protein [Conexibacter arvalis]|uniref:Tetraprenyl-beta-curcumene synthase n=1 Tax=Conexibacter arvalis TaxID=912552 RepID=A0A840IGP6_9ACTN|nr:DUF2600 family protein [Conexibacter arvalis]MBB4664227.1 tetraprenyl-beta-curcumene synthase [Conexibacter arvalis]
MRDVRDAGAMVAVVGRYYLSISWRVRRQLRRWHARAERIADPALRATAVEKLRDEQLHAHAAAVFAVTAPRRHVAPLVELAVAFAVMFDYLDAVSEEPADDQLANGLQLFRALQVALDPALAPEPYYAAHPVGAGEGDGGYLDDLAAACRAALARLPSADVVRPLAVAAAARCGGAQSRTHAVASRGPGQLREWAATLLPDDRGYAWWELTAGAAASLSVHALFAAAADPRVTTAEARRLDAAYFPSICALATLLDSLIDYDADRRTGAHSYVGYYDSAGTAAERLAAIAADGVAATAGLRHRRRHRVIAIGVAGFYLSAAGAHGAYARPAARQVVAALNPLVLRPILALAAAKRRVNSPR